MRESRAEKWEINRKEIILETEIRTRIRANIEKCLEFERKFMEANGDIKEAYQNTILDDYFSLLSEIENGYSAKDFGICVEQNVEEIKRYYMIYFMLDERIYKQLNEEIESTQGWRAEARIRLYMMYLKDFREVLFLLSNGFLDCAVARLRTLYELGVYISIINDNTDELSERFCKYCNVQSLKMAETFATEDRIKAMSENVQSFGYEKGYSKENGWARILFPNIKDKGKVSFFNLAELTEYKQYYQMYKVSCNFVHGSLFSSLESLDSAKEQRHMNFWNTSPSNEGVNEVIHFIKLYLILFITEYIHSEDQKVIFENMLALLCAGKDVLNEDVEYK